MAGLCLAGGLSVGSAGVPSFTNPFMAIAHRNVFALRPPDPPRVETIKPPGPKAVLTGITSVLGIKQALLEIDFPAKPPQPAKKEWCILAEGERHGPIQVVRINEKAATVDVSNSGEICTLKFEKATAQPTPTPPRPTVFPTYRLARHYP